MFKQALRTKLRITTTKGKLSVEQLYDLSIEELDQLAVTLQEEAQKASKSFIGLSKADELSKLKFNVVLEVLQDKINIANAEARQSQNKKHNDKILALIAKKQDEALKGLSIEELQAQLR